MLHKKLLQILVGKVDAKLLEAVRLEVLEPEDVQHANGALVGVPDVGLVDGVVDLLDDVDEEPAVDALGEGVPNVLGLVRVQCGHHGLSLGTRQNGF